MSPRAAAWLAAPVAEQRIGVKGPRAAQLLQQLGIPVPEIPNSWVPLSASEGDGSFDVVARLGSSEYFIEERDAAPGIASLQQALQAGTEGAYPVLREDFALVLGGAAADAVLAQVCNVNLGALALEGRPVVMTLAIGVGVLVLPQISDEHGKQFRIWCDPSYGAYLWTELEEIATRISAGRA